MVIALLLALLTLAHARTRDGAGSIAARAQHGRSASAAKPAVAAAAGSVGASLVPWVPAYGTAAATDLARLPYLEPTVTGGGQSSFDRNTADRWHGNRDLNNFLARGPRGNVMLDQQGPGCVYRIWVTSKRSAFASEWIKVYFDGSATPAIDMTMAQIFSGTNAPFLAPIVQSAAGSSGGYVSYLPLCYHSSILITTNMTRYYNIGYVSYPAGTAIRTWTPGQGTAAMRQEWTDAGADPIPAAGNAAVSGQVALSPGKAQTILDLSGADSIRSIKIAIPGITPSSGAAASSVLDHTWIKIYWDGQSVPDVSAPLGSFFAMGQFGSYPVRGLVAGMQPSGTMYMYLPMPFGRHATITLLNTAAIGLPAVTYQIQYAAFTGNLSRVGYFRTKYTVTAPARVGRDIPILNVGGAGKLVGVTASYAGDLKRSYLEGDERIYVDGSRSPAFYGTGTEDFFNGGYYFDQGPYSQPMSGNTAHMITATADETAAYRFFLQDAVPFRRHITVSIQHGPYDNTADTTAAMLAYYYQRPAAQSVLTDMLNVGDRASEAAHHYLVTGQAWAGRSAFQYAGTADTRTITDTGVGFTGRSRFTMAIRPDNVGVDLRRRYDQGIASQKVAVYVDGTFAGIWFVAGRNPYHRWADTDFVIPGRLTAGRSKIAITLRYVSSAKYVTAYRYWAYTVTP